MRDGAGVAGQDPPRRPGGSARVEDVVHPGERAGGPEISGKPEARAGQQGASPLARSIALYRERLKENGVPLSSFNARI